MAGGRDSDDLDPRGLIADAYAMEGIDVAQCRTIFLDWVLGLPDGCDVQTAIREMARRHADTPEHPMSSILRAARETPPVPRRRGRRRR